MSHSIFAKLTILIVDDSVHMRRLLRQLLGVLGVGQVVVAADGDEAWSQLLRYTPDIVITDAAMAPVDGFTLARKLRSAECRDISTMPVIMVSAHTEISAIKKAREIGISQFLCKPLSPRLLYERLIEVINQPREFMETLPGSHKGRWRQEMNFGAPVDSNSVAYL